MDRSMPGFPILHQLLDFAQTHVHWVGDDSQPSHPLLPPSSPDLNISQHQGLFQWVGSLHQVTKILELQLQHQPFQWIFRVDFLQVYSPSFKFLLQKVCSPSFLQSSLMHGHSPIFLSLCEFMEWYYWQVIQIVLLTEFGARTKTQETNKNPQSVEFATIRIIKIPQLERSIVQTKHIPGFYSGFSLLLGWHPSLLPWLLKYLLFLKFPQHSLCPHHGGYFHSPFATPQHLPSPSHSSSWLRAYTLLCITFVLPKSVFPTKALAKVCSFCCPISQHGAWHRLGAQSIFIVGIIPCNYMMTTGNVYLLESR